jgi:hypothetical protein
VAHAARSAAPSSPRDLPRPRRAHASRSPRASNTSTASTPRTARCCRDELDLIVHVGDYIYELTWGKEEAFGALTRLARVLHARRLPRTLRTVQVGCRSAGRARSVPVARHVGRPRSRQRLCGRHLGGKRRARAVPRAPAPRRTAPITSTCHCLAEPRRSARTCGSTRNAALAIS